MIRRIIVPTREIINSLLRDHAKAITSVTQTYLRDCYDHAVHLLDLVETYREVSAGLLDVYLSSVSNRMNEVMKVLTVISTVFIPLTFLAGVYGMNFDPDSSPFNMPELRAHWGYPGLIVTMCAITAFQLFLFWHKGWLSKPDPTDNNQDDQTKDT